MRGDWLKLHRALLDSAVMRDAELCRLWVWCLLRSNWNAQQWVDGSTIDAGCFVMCYRKAAEQLHSERTAIQRGLRRLELLGNLKVHARKRYTMVEVLNWEKYQSDDVQSDEATPERLTKTRRKVRRSLQQSSVLAAETCDDDNNASATVYTSETRESATNLRRTCDDLFASQVDAAAVVEGGDAEQVATNLRRTCDTDATQVRQIEEGKNTDSDSKESSSVEHAATTPKPDVRPELPEHLRTLAFWAAWADFTQMRRERRKPVTPTSAKLLVSKLARVPVGVAIAALNDSTANGWLGVFTERHEQGASHARPTGTNGQQQRRGTSAAAGTTTAAAVAAERANCKFGG